MRGARTVGLDAAFGTSHGSGRFRDVHILPVTQQEGLALTGGQALDFFLDDAHGLHALEPVGAALGGLRSRLALQRLQQVGVLAIALVAQVREQRDPGIAHLLAAKPVVDGVLQDALEQRRQLGGAAVAVFFGQLDHGVLDDVQGGLFVPYREYRVLEGAAFGAGEKIG